MSSSTENQGSSVQALLGRTLIVVAHPDDECIAFGGTLQRMERARVLYMTDGSPEDPYFWKDWGTRAAYARMRQDEAHAALARVGVAEVEFLADMEPALTDQHLFRNLDRAYQLLRARVREYAPQAILTLAYEGGHPDHDSCNLLSATVGREMGVAVWETPLYHRDPADEHKGVLQDFTFHTGSEIRLELAEDELERKAEMCAEYPSQGDFLKTFDLDCERFRPIADYDYTRPPHAGKLNYEVWQWTMTGEEVSREFAAFLRGKSSRSSASTRQPAT